MKELTFFFGDGRFGHEERGHVHGGDFERNEGHGSGGDFKWVGHVESWSKG